METDYVIKQGVLWLAQLSSRAYCDSHRLLSSRAHCDSHRLLSSGTYCDSHSYQAGYTVTHTMLSSKAHLEPDRALRNHAETCLNVRYLMTISVAKIAQHGDEWTNMEHQWNYIDTKSRSSKRKTCPSGILYTINPTWSGLWSNPCLRNERLATKCLSHGTARVYIAAEKLWTGGVFAVAEPSNRMDE